MAPWLDERQPNIILFQEIKTAENHLWEEKWDQLGYHAVFFGQPRYNGVGIASKARLDHVVRGLSEYKSETLEARYIEAITYGIKLASVYVPQGKNFDSPSFLKKKQFFEALTAHQI
jgi:exodeoxyribonuclease-3